jgi:hypothetical protein
MSWLVDNANTLYILLGLLAAALVFIWRSNRQIKYLGYAAGALVLIGLIWILGRFYISDSKQLEMNVNAMADAVVNGKVDDLFKHISKDFVYKGMTRDTLYEVARKSIQANKIANIGITQFKVEEISRHNKTAKARFTVTPFVAAEQPRPFATQAEFVLEGEQWKLKAVRFFLFGTDQEISLPGL